MMSSNVYSLVIIVITIILVVNSVESRAPKLGYLFPRKNQTIGSMFHVFCAIEEGTLPVFFEWYKNTIHLKSKPDVNYRIETSEISSTFTIKNIELSDQANYTCIVKNQFGSDSQSVLLSIRGKCNLIFIFLMLK